MNLSIEEIFSKVSDFLQINGRYKDENDAWNYICEATYNRLMLDQYGNNPLERIKKNTETPTEQPGSEQKTDNHLSKKVKLNIK